jgi:hypothetical protein
MVSLTSHTYIIHAPALNMATSPRARKWEVSTAQLEHGVEVVK